MTKAYIAPDVILSHLVGNPMVSMFERAKEQKLTLVTSRLALYEAVACIEVDDVLKVQNLRQILLECEFAPEMDVMGVPTKFIPMRDDRKAHLRKVAGLDNGG